MAGEAGGVSEASSLSQRWPRAPLILQAGRKAVLGALGGGIFMLFTNLVCVWAPHYKKDIECWSVSKEGQRSW